MKRIVYLLAATVLLSFTRHAAEDIDGIWIGYYRSDSQKEKVIVKFSSKDRMEFYTGGVDDKTRCDGSYSLLGDSISFTYRTPEGRQFRMQGHFNYRKTYLDGIWSAGDQSTGKFYLEKQKVQERSL